MAIFAVVENGKVVNTIEADEAFVTGKLDHILCPSDVGIGYTYTGGIFFPPPVPDSFDIVVTEIICSNPAAIIKADLSSILCSVGDTVTVKMRAQKNGELLPITDFFKTPVTASDGREIFYITSFESGVGNLTKKVPDSGFWTIDQYGINKYNTTGTYFNFKGLDINVQD